MSRTHISGTVQALYRVFILPSLPINHFRSAATRTPPLPLQGTTTQPFSTTLPHRAKTRAPEQRAQKWNEEIKAEQIYLVDLQTHELSPLQLRKDILRNLNKDTQRLVQVDEQPGPRDAFDDADPEARPRYYPVCKILGKKDMYQQEKNRKAAQKEQKKASATASSVKTLELNWAIDGNDLGHRLDRMKEFLSEGRKVEVVLAAKKAGRKATAAECEDVLARIRRVVDEVPGAREAKALEGKMGGFCTVLFQGRTPQVQGLEKGGGVKKGKQKVEASTQ